MLAHHPPTQRLQPGQFVFVSNSSRGIEYTQETAEPLGVSPPQAVVLFLNKASPYLTPGRIRGLRRFSVPMLILLANSTGGLGAGDYPFAGHPTYPESGLTIADGNSPTVSDATHGPACRRWWSCRCSPGGCGTRYPGRGGQRGSRPGGGAIGRGGRASRRRGCPPCGRRPGPVPGPSARLGATGGIGEDPLAAGLGQGVVLEVELLVGGGDTGVADEHGSLHSPIVPEPVPAVKSRDLEFGMRKGTVVRPRAGRSPSGAAPIRAGVR